MRTDSEADWLLAAAALCWFEFFAGCIPGRMLRKARKSPLLVKRNAVLFGDYRKGAKR